MSVSNPYVPDYMVHPAPFDLSTSAQDAVVEGQQVYQGHGVPSDPPNDPDLPALYTDLDTGSTYSWNAETAAWI